MAAPSPASSSSSLAFKAAKRDPPEWLPDNPLNSTDCHPEALLTARRLSPKERLPALGADLLAALSAGGGGLPCAAKAVRAALTLQPGLTLRRARCCCRRRGLRRGEPCMFCPTAAELRLPSELFRIVLLRRLRMPLPAFARACRCGRPADALGDHVAACPTSGVLRNRAVPVERAIARLP